jgi:DNA/RNA endonuclease YhcR with UshA esterase domain
MFLHGFVAFTGRHFHFRGKTEKRSCSYLSRCRREVKSLVVQTATRKPKPSSSSTSNESSGLNRPYVVRSRGICRQQITNEKSTA